MYSGGYYDLFTGESFALQDWESFIFSADEDKLFATSTLSQSSTLLDRADLKLLLHKENKRDSLGQITITPDSKRMVLLGTHASYIWNLETGEYETSYRTEENQMLTNQVCDVKGNWIAELCESSQEDDSGGHRRIRVLDLNQSLPETLSPQLQDSDYFLSRAHALSSHLLSGTSAGNQVKLWDLMKGDPLKVWEIDILSSQGLTYSDRYQTLLNLQTDGRLLFYKEGSSHEGTLLLTFPSMTQESASVSPFSIIDSPLIEFDTESIELFQIDSISLSNNQDLLAFRGTENIQLYNWRDTSHELTIWESAESVCFSPDDRLLAYWGMPLKPETFSIVPINLPQKRLTFNHGAYVEDVAFLHQGERCISVGVDGVAIVWDVVSGQWIAKIIQNADGNWAVISPDGHFDVSSLNAVEGLNWKMPDQLDQPIALENYMREFYTPNLLKKLLVGESGTVPTRALLGLNRARPSLEISKVDYQIGAQSAAVWLEVSNEEEPFLRAHQDEPRCSGLYDLHFFRDGHLALQSPAAGGGSALSNNQFSLEALERWRKQTEVIPPAGGKKREIGPFTIQLPAYKDGDEIELSVYGFNDDWVKSDTDSYDLEVSLPTSFRKPHAYIITVGVSENAVNVGDAFKLKSAHRDAVELAHHFREFLEATDHFSGISDVRLLGRAYSNFLERHEDTTKELTANKANILNVLESLTTQASNEDIQASIPERYRKTWRPAAPEDYVFIHFSGHGFTDENGAFYFVPYDIPSDTQTSELTPAIRQASITGDELSFILRRIDSDNLFISLDTCYSEHAATGSGFKPGPFGNRGMGQMAWDKQAVILTAAYERAAELRFGRLTQAMLNTIRSLGQVSATTSVNTIALEVYRRSQEPFVSSPANSLQRFTVNQKPELFDYASGKTLSQLAVYKSETD